MADDGSNIGFAWLCSVRHKGGIYATCCLVPQGTHGNPLIVCGLRTHPRSAPNLERHGSSKMQTSGWLEMPHFLNRISRCIPSEIEGYVFLVYFYHTKRDCPLKASVPLLCLCIKTSLLCQQFSDWSHNTLRSLPALSRAEVIWSWMLCDLLPQTALSLS